MVLEARGDVFRVPAAGREPSRNLSETPGTRETYPALSPDGKTVVQFKLPDPMVTNVCFGGADMRTAYATLSMTGKLVSFQWPRPGLKLAFG